MSSHKGKIYNISDGILIGMPGSCPKGVTWGYCGGWEVWDTMGVGSVSQKFNQTCCVSYLHEWHMQRHNCFGIKVFNLVF